MFAHSSIDEHGKGRGGQAGDQTTREVCIRSFYVYNGGWGFCLRPKNNGVALRSALAAERGCANNNIGYDMNQRNTLHTEAKKVDYDLSAIKNPCESDCSSFMTVCAIAGGVSGLEYTGNAPTTSTMKNAFLRTGEYDILTDAKYLNSDKYLKRGDILVSAGHHTVMNITDGECVKKSVQTLAKEVIDGLWSKGDERKNALANAGYKYAEVQAEVNRILKSEPKEVSANHVDQKGIDLLKRFEGCKLTAYRLAGETYYTIGYGHSGADVLPSMTISQERAEELLKIDLVKFENYVKKYVTDIVLTQNRLNALVSYTYNRGVGKLKSELVPQSHTVQEYADNIVRLWGSNQRYKDALIRRRKAERELFLS